MGNSDSDPRSTALVQSVDRAIRALELLAKHGQAGITEIASELGVHKSTASRLVSVLEARGLVEQLGDRGKYTIGFGIVRLASAVTGRVDLAKLGQPICQELADRLGETVNVAIADGDAAINVSQALGSSTVAAHNWVGQRTPLHATSSGRVLLAHMDERTRAEILRGKLERYTPHTITDPAELAAELERARAEGFAACFEELEMGLHAVAVPVRDRHGAVVAAISVSGPSYRLSRQRVRQVIGELARGAAQLSAQLGYLR